LIWRNPDAPPRRKNAAMSPLHEAQFHERLPGNPGVNDSDEELGSIAGFVASVGREVPWHVSQFYPAWKMLDRPVTPVETLRRAADEGKCGKCGFTIDGVFLPESTPGSDRPSSPGSRG